MMRHFADRWFAGTRGDESRAPLARRDNAVMALITLQAAQLAFGDVPLLDKTALSIETSERIGLIGRNGTGKSSLLKILAGMEHLDDGVIQFQQDLKLAYVAQEPVLTPEMTVFDAVSEGLSPLKAVLERYYAGEGDLNALQNKSEMQDGWTREQRCVPARPWRRYRCRSEGGAPDCRWPGWCPPASCAIWRRFSSPSPDRVTPTLHPDGPC